MTTVSKHDLQRSHLKCSISNNNLNSNNIRLDSSPIQIDSINNNNNNNNNNATDILTSGDARNLDTKIGRDSDEQKIKKKSMKRNTSLLSFKSLDFHIKSIYSGLRSKNHSDTTRSNTNSSVGSGRRAPYLKVETVDESENLLVTYPQSPYQTRRSSFDKSSSQLLNIAQYEVCRSQASSPYLCPSPIPGTIRRSSTSDIMSRKSNSASESRRPSTSDLLRRARERRGSESNRLGRSMSHGGLARGGFRGTVGRRTSMAF